MLLYVDRARKAGSPAFTLPRESRMKLAQSSRRTARESTNNSSPFSCTLFPRTLLHRVFLYASLATLAVSRSYYYRHVVIYRMRVRVRVCVCVCVCACVCVCVCVCVNDFSSEDRSICSVSSAPLGSCINRQPWAGLVARIASTRVKSCEFVLRMPSVLIFVFKYQKRTSNRAGARDFDDTPSQFNSGNETNAV